MQRSASSRASSRQHRETNTGNGTLPTTSALAASATLVQLTTIDLQNRQRSVRFNLRWLRRFAGLTMEPCLKESANGRFGLTALEEVSVAIVSDRAIARVHEQFMEIPGPTDVITFEHGEIVMSAQTARLQALERGHPIETELGLYLVHGLLHLNGFQDASSEDAARMDCSQHRILDACLAQLPPP